MIKRVLAIGLVLAVAPPANAVGQTGPGTPRYTAEGELVRPADYREWVFVTSGLGMTYGPAASSGQGRPPRFDNVFVTPTAYREFQRTGTWPEGTMFVLEIRTSAQEMSINNGGYTQGEVVALEASVKDSGRYPDGGWAYFNFTRDSALLDSVAPLPATARCYSCHSGNGAVDNTFVQFYPILFETAQRLGTIRPDYDPGQHP